MTRLDDLYALRNRITDEIADELARLKRIQLAAGRIEVPCDEEPDVIGKGRRGRPRMANPYTVEEARDYHRRYVAGERAPDVIAGHRQYHRQSKRTNRKDVA